jgi:two-component system response regulator RegX3
MAGHILIADDDAALTSAVRWYLEAEGFEVSHAEDGNTAWDMFQKSGADAVILDVMMPGLDGFQLCRLIRDRS